MYSTNMSLLRRIELSDGSTINDYVYDYRVPDASQPRRISKSDLLAAPITRKGIAGLHNLQNVNYNPKGQIDSGSYLKDGNLIRFQYHYQRGAKYNGALIRAEFVLPHMSCTVSWCAAPRRRPENPENWVRQIPSDRSVSANRFRSHILRSLKQPLSLAPMSGKASTSTITSSTRLF
jgi:hypothetical protein